MIIAPPLDPSAVETKTQDVSAEKRCIGKLRYLKSLDRFDVSGSYVTLSPEFGVIVRLDLEQANDVASGLTARYVCWTDKASGDLVSALAVGHKGTKLPE
jgi:hypothetical protein